MQRVKVAFLLISPGKAGVESVVKNILKYIDKQKVEPYLVASSEIMSYLNEFIENDHCLDLGYFFTQPKNRILLRIFKYLKYKLNFDSRKLTRWANKTELFLNKNGIQIVHAHLVWDYYIASELKTRNPKIVYINTMHGTLALDPADDYFPFFDRNTILKIIGNVSIFTSACNYFFDLLKMWKVNIEKAYLIPNGIVNEDIPEKDRSDEILNICFMGGGRPHQKGGDLLIHALKIILEDEKITHFKLLVYGSVPENSKERVLAETLGLNDHVVWQGFAEPPLHLRGMEISDVFVLPSRHEGVANTLMEAIGYNLPIIATNVGGTPELIVHNKNGLLCYPDARDLADKLKILLLDKNLRHKFAKENESIKQKYYWQKVVKDYANLYLEALAK
ncbi:MAG: glycosyltransferase family 4 protein [Flavobacteriales bacterium]|nr:glycosyltransferase family 4 protein [Flavobacteriales bacterium]